MYENLKAQLEKRSISVAHYAKILGISEKTARNKLNGITEFNWTEVQETKKLFSEYTYEYLFNKVSNIS